MLNTKDNMTHTNLHPTPSPLEQETGAIIRALQNILINDNPLRQITMEAKKEQLAKKLQEEKDRLPEYSVFGDKTNFKDYDLAIEYLKTGSYPPNYDRFDILSSCIEDFETICNDYEVE